MSWLNQGLATLRGQLSGLGEALTEEGDSDERQSQLEASLAEYRRQIEALQKENADYKEENLRLTKKEKEKEGVDNGNEEKSWFWDPPEETEASDANKQENQRLLSLVETLQAKLSDVKPSEELLKELNATKEENKILTRDLEDLDNQNQDAMKKLLNLKLNLQENYEHLKKDNELLQKRLDEINSTSETRDEAIGELEQVNSKLNKNLETLMQKYDKLEKVHRALKENTEKFQEENQYLSEENSRLSSDLDTLVKKYDELKKSNEHHEKLHEEVNEENFKLMEECAKLQNELDELGKTDERRSSPSIEKSKKSDVSLNSNAQEIIESLKFEIVELQNKLNTNEEIKRLNLENAQLKREIETLTVDKDTISCVAIKDIIARNVLFDINGVDNNLKHSALSDDVLKYVDGCLKAFTDCKVKNDDLEMRLWSDVKEIEELQTKIKDINTEMHILNQDLSQCEHECSEMKKNNDFLIAEIGALKSAKLEPILEQNEDNIETLQNELEASNALNIKLNEDLQTYKTKISNMEASVEKYKTQVRTMSAENEKCKIDSSIVENDNVLLRKQICDLEADRTKSDELKSRCDELQKSNLDLKAALDSNEDIVARLNARIADLESKLSEMSVLDSSTKSELEKTLNEFNESKKYITDYESKFRELSEKNRSIEDQLNEARQLLVEEKSKSVAEFTGQITSITESKDLEILTLSMEVKELTETIDKLKSENVELGSLNQTLLQYQKDHQNNDTSDAVKELQSKQTELEDTIKSLEAEKTALEARINDYDAGVKEDQVRIAEFGLVKLNMEGQLEQLAAEKNELIKYITQKQNENISYHTEIQRLNAVLFAEAQKYQELAEANAKLQTDQCEKCADYTDLKNSGITREAMENLTDKNKFLIEKCDVLAENLLQEQANSKRIAQDKSVIYEREQSLAKEVERLRKHLLEIEDAHTQELIVAEQKYQELQSCMTVIEEKAKHSTTLYTSNSIRANQEVETLRNQIKLVEKQRDDIQVQLYQSEDRNNKNLAALTNLQCVLEQFQMDKNRDNEEATGRVRRDLELSLEEKKRLHSEIAILQDKLTESNNGLKAAARLSDQLDARSAQLNDMKDTVRTLEDELENWKRKYNNAISNQHDKVDKMLVKNMIVGFVQATESNRRNDKTQVLKILSTVLDFDEADMNRIGLGSSKASIQDSLTQEFVKFLEKESRPTVNTVLPNLLNLGQSSTNDPAHPVRKNSKTSIPGESRPQSNASRTSQPSPSINVPIVPVAVARIPSSEASPITVDGSTDPGNAFLNVSNFGLFSPIASPDVGVNQTRNTEGAILKNVLKDT